MARTSIQNVLQLNDAAQSWNFDLFFPTLPGGGDARTLTYKCKTTELPSSKIEPVKIELHGVAKQEAGRALYDHTFNCTVMETIDWGTIKDMRRWRDYMRSWKRNKGTNATAYKINLELDLYDNAGEISNTIILAGAFLTDIQNVAFDGAASTAIDVQLAFSFDYLDDGLSF